MFPGLMSARPHHGGLARAPNLAWTGQSPRRGSGRPRSRSSRLQSRRSAQRITLMPSMPQKALSPFAHFSMLGSFVPRMAVSAAVAMPPAMTPPGMPRDGARSLLQPCASKYLTTSRGTSGRTALSSTRFWRALREHPVPLLEATIRQWRDRSMSLDIYAWLAAA
jgi:hypothetical protein